MSFGRPQLYNLEAMPFTYSVGGAMTRIRFSRQTLLIENSVTVFFCDWLKDDFHIGHDKCQLVALQR